MASYPKSGNTWIRAIAYSAIFGQMNIHELGTMIPNFAFFASQLNDRSVDTPGQIRHLWESAQKQLCESGGTNKFCSKRTMLPANMMWVNFHPQNIPKKRYMWSRSKNVAISYSSHFGHNLDIAIEKLLDESNTNFRPNDLSRGEFLSSWENHVRSWQKVPFPVLQIRYEDLIATPVEYIEKIVTFLDIEPAKKIEDIACMTNFEKLAEQEKTEGFAEAGESVFFRQGSVSQWRQYDKHKFESLVAKFEPTMKSLGYV